jgi:hypothetical protein
MGTVRKNGEDLSSRRSGYLQDEFFWGGADDYYPRPRGLLRENTAIFSDK